MSGLQSFDPVKARAHRLQEAELGLPLLRGCASTSANALVAHFDGLDRDKKLDFARQLSDFAEAQATQQPMSVDKRAALLQRFPLLVGQFDIQPRKATGLHMLPVKVIAGVMKDAAVGGIEGWADGRGLSAEARRPAAAHAATLDEMVPVAPKRLLQLIGKILKDQYGATATPFGKDHISYAAVVAGRSVKLDLLLPGRGAFSWHQFGYNLTLPGSLRLPFITYEGIWLTSSQWDYVTENNAERSVNHFARVVEAAVSVV